MKAFKGFMIYTGIVLLSLVIIGALVIGMMFFTKIQLFGYYFVQTNKNDYFHGEISFANPDGVTGDQLSSIVPIKNVNLNIETGAYGILVEPISDLDKKELKIYTDNIYVGFLDGSALGDNLDDNRYPRIKVVKQHDNAGNMEINITLSEPQGLLSMSELSLLRLRVPFKVNEEVVTYNINAKTHNGNIKLINSKDDKGDFADPLVVTGLKLETNKGDVSLEGFGNKYGKKTENLVLDNLDIKTNGGTFDFTNFRNVKVNRKVTLDSEKANYYFNVLDARNGINGGVEINGTVVKFVADAVYCGMDGFIYKTSTGVLKINNLFTGNIEENIEAVTEKDAENNDVPTGELKRKITSADPYENTIFTDSAVVELGTVVGKLGLYNEFGDVTINLLSNQASVRTENGNITIKKSGVLLNEQDEDINYANKSSMILYSDFGDIYVGEYYQDAVLYSKKGKITANSKTPNSKDHSTRGDRYYYTDISTKDGKVTATTEKNPVKIVASDSANVSLTIKDIFNDTLNPFTNAEMYQAVSKNGTVEVLLPLKAYEVKVIYNKLEGSIGATSSFGEDYVQINKFKPNQPKMLIQGNKVKLACLV